MNSNLKVQINEVLYPAPGDAEKVIGMVTTLSDAELEDLTPKYVILLKNDACLVSFSPFFYFTLLFFSFRVLADHPNTYTFTKALAEHEVAQGFNWFPAAIVRPSMSKSINFRVYFNNIFVGLV